MFVKIGILLLLPFACMFFQDETLLKSIERGQKVYEQTCIKCHKQNGEGVAKFFHHLPIQIIYVTNVSNLFEL